MYMFTRNRHAPRVYTIPKRALVEDADFCPPYAEPNGKIVIGRGNGWIGPALARYMEIAHADEKHRDQYLKDFKAMSKTLLAASEDGYWNISLHDPDISRQRDFGKSSFRFYMTWGIRHVFCLPKSTCRLC